MGVCGWRALAGGVIALIVPVTGLLCPPPLSGVLQSPPILTLVQSHDLLCPLTPEPTLCKQRLESTCVSVDSFKPLLLR